MLIASLAGAASAEIELPPGPDRDLVYGTCRTCHDLQYLQDSAGIPESAWSELLDSMKQYGLRIPPDRRARILRYLGAYLGPNPPPASSVAAVASAAAPADGKTLFNEQCSSCHQVNGAGQPGTFPPLAGNPDLMLAPHFPVFVVLNGLQGKITVEGKTYNAQMPSFAHLSDAEVAAVINYIREAWGNDALRPADMSPLDDAAVATVRANEKTPDEVHAYRASLK
ncbi:c-type cytochrome [Photobacterium sp. 53610]|uniref:c-type cytochrome n=1 Tax=Photobacterium sp. 53610 TaxID=3102789 RepID=UPI002ED7AA17